MAVKAQEIALAQIDVQATAERIGRQVATDVLGPILRPLVKEQAAAEAAPFAPAVTAAIVVPVLLVGGLIIALAVRVRGNGRLDHDLEGAGRTRVLQYTIVHPSGEVEQSRIPPAWSPFEVADKFVHSLVFYRLPKRLQTSTRNAGFTVGPAAIFVSRIGPEQYVVPSIPSTDGAAFHLWRQLKREGHRV